MSKLIEKAFKRGKRNNSGLGYVEEVRFQLKFYRIKY